MFSSGAEHSAIKGNIDVSAHFSYIPVTLPDMEASVAEAKSKKNAKERVARYRTRTVAQGSKRVEVTVPDRDSKLVKAIAKALRGGGRDARQVRDALRPIIASSKATTGHELVAFLRRSPLAKADLDFERDQSTGRSAEFD